MRTAVIIQARTDSTRLPGKVLKRLGDATVLERVLARCLDIPGADVVCCATTDRDEDQPIVDIANKMTGIEIFRGSVTDVLGRYAGAARAVGAEIVMRVTSDCPAIDPAVCGDVLRLRADRNADYACNNMPPSWPHGLDCEAFTAAALYDAEKDARQPDEREHVTPWIRNHPSLRRANLPKPGEPAADRRWVLDYPEDLAFFQALFDLKPAATAGWREIMALVDAHPEIAGLNASRAQRT